MEKYKDPYVAIRDSYFSTLGCIEYPKPGGAGRVAYQAGSMGIHFLNPALVGPVPTPGQDTDEVLGRLLGYDRASLDSLRQAGAIA